jgi:hypothetical protein
MHRLWNAMLLGLQKYWLGWRLPSSRFQFSQIGSNGFGMKPWTQVAVEEIW